MTEEAIFDLFRKNCVHYAGNYEITPGGALVIARKLTEELEATIEGVNKTLRTCFGDDTAALLQRCIDAEKLITAAGLRR